MSTPATDSPDWQPVASGLSPVLASGSYSLALGQTEIIVGPTTPWASTMLVTWSTSGEADVSVRFIDASTGLVDGTYFTFIIDPHCLVYPKLVVPNMGDRMSLLIEPSVGAAGTLYYVARGMAGFTPPRALASTPTIINLASVSVPPSATTAYYPTSMASGFANMRTYASAVGLTVVPQAIGSQGNAPTLQTYDIPAGEGGMSFYLPPNYYTFQVGNAAAAAIDLFLTVSVLP